MVYGAGQRPHTVLWVVCVAMHGAGLTSGNRGGACVGVWCRATYSVTRLMHDNLSVGAHGRCEMQTNALKGSSTGRLANW
eukprot:1078175-Pelagomonas_calceolata.AAC.4